MTTLTPESRTTTAFPLGALIAIVAGMFMVTLDFFIVNVAIPSLQSDLGATPAQVQAVVVGFGVAYAALMITGGRLGDLYGRRRMLMTGMAVFVAASALCGLAPTAEWLIGGRVLQGVGAAVLSPQVLALLNIVFVGAHRTKAFTALGLAIGCGGTFGQLIGGALMQTSLGWRTIFLVNLPIGLAAMVIGRRSIPESHGHRTGLDLTGTMLIAAAMIALVLPLTVGRDQDWPTWTVVLLVASVPLGAAFMAQQRRSAAPLVAPILFKERAFSVGLVVVLCFFSSMASFFLVLALYLQEGRGLSPLDAGLVFAATGVGYVGASAASPVLAARMGRHLLSLGALVFAAGFAVLADIAHHQQDGAFPLIVGLLVAGIGMGLVMLPLMDLILAGVDPAHAAAAGGALSSAQEGGNALGVAVIGGVFFGASGGVAAGFVTCVVILAVVQLGLAALAQLLPR